MYNYSPIKTFRVKNFRNLGSVDIDFTDSPIVTLVGENESGKTSLIKAFSMCALHDSPRDQKDYIRDGTKMLGVEITLEDNTQVVRVKEANGLNLYRVIHPDGTIWDATKITDGLPKEVQDVMGLITEPETGEYLHIRTYEDKLLFVVTPSSTNYKVMYNALKVEQLTKAIKNGSNEANNIKNEINRNESSIQTLHSQLSGISIIDTEPLIEIRDRLVKQLAVLSKLEKILELKNRLEDCENKLGALALIQIYGLKEISESTANRINNISRLLNNLRTQVNCRERYRELDNIGIIDLSVLERVRKIIDKKNSLMAKIEDTKTYMPVDNLTEISESCVNHINSALTMTARLNELTAKASAIDLSSCSEITDTTISQYDKATKIFNRVQDMINKIAEVAQINAEIYKINEYLKQSGVAVETCPKCGESVVFNINSVGALS